MSAAALVFYCAAGSSVICPPALSEQWPQHMANKEGLLCAGQGVVGNSQSRVQIMSIPRLRDYRGPALFSYGLRPFFFFGSVYAGAIMLVWLPVFYGQLKLSTAFSPRDWHVHEIDRKSVV